MKEAVLCSVVVDKLRTEGWKVICEFNILYQRVDVVALKDDKLMAVEAKQSFTRTLKGQLMRSQCAVDYSLAAVGTNPIKATVKWCKTNGIGIWIIKEGIVEELLSPKGLSPLQSYKNPIIERINQSEEDDLIGGKPNLKGVGPAITVQNKVNEYKISHPTATWREIFANVPNHYANHKNMYSALRINANRNRQPD